jgi:uncharacterized membrane protein
MNLKHDEEIVLNDESIEAGIVKILSAGIAISVLLVLIGAAIYLGRHGLEIFSQGGVPNEQETLSDLSSVIKSVLSMHGRGIIQLGLFALILTPIARVVFSVCSFVQRRDWTYVIITSIALAVLCYGLLGA